MVENINQNSEKFASRLSLEIIKEVAPDELDLFEDIKEEYLKNPDIFQEKVKTEEKMLGFGGGVGEVFLTTTVLPLVWGAVAYVGKAGIDSLKEEGSKALAKWIKGKVEGRGEQPSKENLKTMREYLYSNVIAQGVDKEKAGIIADSFIGKLALM